MPEKQNNAPGGGPQVLPSLEEDPDESDLRLVRDQSYTWSGLDDDEGLIVIRGEMVLAQRRRRGLSEWLQIGEAIEVLQREVMRQTGATTSMGRRYDRGWERLAPPQMRRLRAAWIAAMLCGCGPIKKPCNAGGMRNPPSAATIGVTR